MAIDTAKLESMAGTFSGVLLRPGDEGYEEARRIHNGLVDKRPALIARCQGTADIVDALHETLDAARLRAVEPDQLDDTAWARFLPAVVTATSLHPITIGMDYGRMNGTLKLEADDG